MAVDFTQKNPDEVLRPEALAEYHAGMKEFHLRLTGLKTDIFIVQKIVDFPADVFTVLEGSLFLRRTVQNSLQIAVLQITKMTTDQGRDARTLTRFKNFIRDAVKEDYRQDYQELLKGARFSARTNGLLQKARHLRDTQIAHALRGPEAPITPKDIMTFDDVKSLAEELIRLFEVASFSSEYLYLPLSYDPRTQHPAGCDSRSDIEKILDSIARESSVIRTPETHPDAWPHRRKRWSQAKLDVYNSYRRKFGLPDA